MNGRRKSRRVFTSFERLVDPPSLPVCSLSCSPPLQLQPSLVSPTVRQQHSLLVPTSPPFLRLNRAHATSSPSPPPPPLQLCTISPLENPHAELMYSTSCSAYILGHHLGHDSFTPTRFWTMATPLPQEQEDSYFKSLVQAPAPLKSFDAFRKVRVHASNTRLQQYHRSLARFSLPRPFHRPPVSACTVSNLTNRRFAHRPTQPTRKRLHAVGSSP